MKAHITAPRVGLLVLILLALVSAALRSRPGYILAVGDVFFVEPRPAVVLEGDLYLWTDGNAGVVNANVLQLPYRLLWALAGRIRMPPWQFQALERGSYLAGAGLAMCLLARPTTSWIAGEIITDTHSLLLPAGYAGSVAFRIGLYDSNTLQRIPVGNGGFILLPDKLSVTSH